MAQGPLSGLHEHAWRAEGNEVARLPRPAAQPATGTEGHELPPQLGALHGHGHTAPDRVRRSMSVPVYERILDLLGAEGIDALFGIPDPGFIHMAMTAEKRGWKVVSPHHEQAGAFMADASSRMTGKPGVGFGTQAP